MAEAPQSAENETSCHVSIAIQNDDTRKEQKILRVPRKLNEGIEEVSQLAKTETNCHVIPIPNDPTSMEQRTKPHQLHAGTVADCPLAGTKKSCDELSVAIPKAPRTSLEQQLTSQLPREMPKQKIPRVPHQLRKVDKKAYRPSVISIGPYYHGKDHLSKMERQKLQYLNELLQTSKQNVAIYLSAIRNMVEEARDCYSDRDLPTEEFIEMMVLDGCFLIQLFLGDSFRCGAMIKTIWHDLVLVENQLPFFVLCELLGKICFQSMGFTDPKNLFIRRILAAFEGRMPGLKVHTTYDDNSIKNVKHLAHLLYSNWRPSEIGTAEKKVGPQNDENWEFIPSATKLRETGIEFKKIKTRGDEKKSLLDIKFKNGTLEMPKVIVDRHTESMYRNLIVCEQFENTDSAFLTDYVLLMDSLIDTGEDVELLCKSGIIYNMLGNNESVAALFNGLGAHINLSQSRFLYAKLFKDVKRHYMSDWNVWKTNLRDEYFNTPWAFISFLAASLLLLLTVLQTIFAIVRPS